MNFKVGDIVRIARPETTHMDFINSISEIENITLLKNIELKGYDDYWFNEKELEHVVTNESINGTAEVLTTEVTDNKEKIGDRVTKPLFDLLHECFKIMGIDYKKTFDEPTVKTEAEEAERILINNDAEVQRKAKAYDKICETLFMASGVIEDGDSFKWIIDPEVVCDEILRIITSDPMFDNNAVIARKRKESAGLFSKDEW